MIEVLLERPHAHLRHRLQKELGEPFYVSAVSRPDEPRIIFVTVPDPDRIAMMREAYASSGIVALGALPSSHPAALGCFTAGADLVLSWPEVSDLGNGIKRLARRLFPESKEVAEYPEEA
ncbi:MAG: hypothetical protein M3164_04925 [Actinomycetota bacterium]|nr:hypothetical protein [Actinomycetota bacterium]